MSRRKIILGCLLVLSAWLAFFGDKTPSQETVGVITANTTKTVSSTRSNNSHSTQAVVAILELADREQWGMSEAGNRTPPKDLFSVHSWAPPPPKPAVTAPVALTAPPVPYTYVGKKRESDAWEVYLTRGEQIMIVREGEVLESLYKVQKIQPPSLTLVYLPLNQAQTIVIGQWE